MSEEAISIVVAVALAFAGYVATYFNNLRLARRKERAELINSRLNDFYGPLYVSSQAGAMAFGALLRKLGRPFVFADRDNPDPKDLAEWKVWLQTVLMPLNEFREKLILENAHLIREEEMPECLLAFIAHSAAYKAVLKKWSDGDFSEHLSVVDYPEELDEYASRSYAELKHEQLELLGEGHDTRLDSRFEE